MSNWLINDTLPVSVAQQFAAPASEKGWQLNDSIPVGMGQQFETPAVAWAYFPWFMAEMIQAGESGSIQSGVGSGAGIATVSAAGISVFAGVSSGSGIATASATGISIAEAVASSAGIAAAGATGIAIFAGAGLSAGIGNANASGQAVAVSDFSVSGIATASATGISIAEAVASSAGIAAAEATGISVFEGVGSSSGIATASAAGKAVGQQQPGGGIRPFIFGIPKRRPIIKSGTARAYGTSDAQAAGEAVWRTEFNITGISKAEAKSKRILSPTDEEALLTLLLAA